MSPHPPHSLPHEKGKKGRRSGAAQGIRRGLLLSDIRLVGHGSISKATGIYAARRRGRGLTVSRDFGLLGLGPDHREDGQYPRAGATLSPYTE